MENNLQRSNGKRLIAKLRYRDRLTAGDIKSEKIDYNTREIVEAGKNPRTGI